MPPDYDCVVVGAGMVGAAQALALHRFGLKILVIDGREPLGGEPGGDVRGLALAPSSRNILTALDVWPAVASRIRPIATIKVSEQGGFGAAEMRAADVGFEALGYVCPADHLMHALEAALTSSVEVRFETSVHDIRVVDDAAVVTVHNEHGATTHSAALVIGADGAGSRVRDILGIKTTSRDYDQHAVVANLSIDGIEPGVAYERFTSDGPLAVLPVAGNRYVAVRCCRGRELERLLAVDDSTYLAELEAGFGYRFGDFAALGERRHHSLRLKRSLGITGDHAVLVGAAANCIHPNGAQGLNLGLRDVAALAAAIKRAVGDSRDPGGADTLSAYAQAREADHRAVVRLTDSLAQVFSSALPLMPTLRNFAMLAFDLTPPVKRWMIRRACGLFGETPLAEWSTET